jgi:MSHA pilin protein MshC
MAAKSRPGLTAEGGVTMIELIVVIIFIGILSAVGIGKFFDRGEFAAQSFADQAAGAMRFAQKVAIAQNRPVYVRFDADSISLCFQTACATSDQVIAPFTPTTDASHCTSSKWYCVLRPSVVSYTISWGALSSTSARYLQFDALGRPFDETVAGVGMILTVSGKSSSAQVRVIAETGYVY